MKAHRQQTTSKMESSPRPAARPADGLASSLRPAPRPDDLGAMESSIRPKARPEAGGYLESAEDSLVILRSGDNIQADAAEACIGALEHQENIGDFLAAEAKGESLLDESNSAVSEDGLLILRSAEPNYGAEAIRALNDSRVRNGEAAINPCE